MKLLFITPGKLPVPATSGGAVETLIQTLIDNNEKTNKHEITLISIYTKEAHKESLRYKNTKFIFINIDDKLYKIYRGIRYIINRIPNIYIGNEYIHRVNKYLKNTKVNYDYIIVENAPQYSLILKKYKEKLIFHSHNDFLNKEINMAKKILNNYNKVFSLSNYISSRIRDIDHNYNAVYTLYNGIELDKFNIEYDPNIRKKLKIKETDFVYLYTGRIVEEKGVKELIEAFNQINDNNSKLIIIGEINNKYGKKLIDISKKNKNIIFTEKITYKDIPKYYKCANVGVVPSIWEEPFALTVIEHMSVGNPVIISKSGAMPELVNENVAITVEKKVNYINNLKDALVSAKKNYNKFDYKKIVDQANKFNSKIYCDTFDKLLNK